MDTKTQDNQELKEPGVWSVPRFTYKYDDFTPAHDWRAGEGSDVLFLALPGFTTKAIQTSLDPTGIIKVSGSLFVGNNTYSRFNSEFRVPEDCSMNGIQKRFVNGILRITFPKKNPFRSKTTKEESAVTPTQVQPEPSQSLLPSQPPHSQLAQQFSPPTQSAMRPQQLQPQPQAPLQPSFLQPEKIQTPPPQLPSQLKQQESQLLSHIQPDPHMVANALEDETNKMPHKTRDEEPSYKTFSETHEGEHKKLEEEDPERIQKRATNKGKEQSALMGTADAMEQLKEHIDHRASMTEAFIAATIGELKLESYIQLAREKLREERQTLLNMGAGAAVLAMAGLGVYICCKIGRKIRST